MGDAIVSSVVKEVVGRLASVADQELRLLWGFKRDLLDLQSKFSRIQAVLEDAEAKQKKDKAIKDWLTKLRTASFEMENILDDVSTEAMLRRVDIQGGIIKQLRVFFSAQNPVAFRSMMAHRVKNIKRRLDEVAAEKSKFELGEGFSEDTQVASDLRLRGRLTTSLVDVKGVVGRVEEKKMISNTICDENLVNHGEGVSVYAICGMGGIGKTTLCQLVYNDQRVTENFDLKMWLCVSDDFDVVRLTRAVLEFAGGSPSALTQPDLLLKEVREKLNGKRFLLVLDDVQSEDREEWELVKMVLNCGQRGSMIMVTTRIETIARMMSSGLDFIHYIRCLPEDECWSLFKRLAFGVGRMEGNISELEPIGKQIVKKCNGLPLAVKALGSLMWSKSSVREWQLVRDSNIWDLPQNEEHVLPALKLSYDNLPHHFRRCFAYCCLFPKDYEMSKDLLIKLWMANRFIPPRGDEHLYELGEVIFQGLVWRSFFQDVLVDSDGCVTFKMHDLMHDLAQSVMGHECSLINLGDKLKFPAEVLHLSSSRGLPTNLDLAKVRSLLSFFKITNAKDRQLGTIVDIPNMMKRIPTRILNQRHLRALDFEQLRSEKLPTSICCLKHLRYLNLSWSTIKVLPESIIYLQNLQVLGLKFCVRLCKLPKGMRFMRNLQFLDNLGCGRLERMPKGMGQLAGLQRLSRFIVGEKVGEGIGELGELNLLGGQLEIEGLEKVKGLDNAKDSKLMRKQNLISLSLLWSSTREECEKSEESKKSEEVLFGCQPHPNLKKLEIYRFRGLKFPSWINNLVNLAQVGLYGFPNMEILPPMLGKLPVLRVLEIYNMNALKSLDVDDSVDIIDYSNNPCSSSGMNSGSILFPSLQALDIKHCPRLVGLPSTKLLKLEKLSIIGCEHLRRRCEKYKGEDWPKVAHVPFININGRQLNHY